MLKFSLTDDLMAFLSDHADAINGLRKGRLLVSFQDGRLVSVTIEEELRVGYEIRRTNQTIYDAKE
jgi:hypothetical protein